MSRGPIPDDFEYPTPHRETLWTLPDKKKTYMARQSPPRNPNDISDISGAHHGSTPIYNAMRTFTSKPDLFDSKTVEGASPKRLIPIALSTNNPLIDKSLRTNDLPNASPNARQFQTKRVTDPLMPIYTMPTKPVAVTMDPSIPLATTFTASSSSADALLHSHKQVRDVLMIDDIRGTRAADNKSNTVVRTTSPPRDNINYNDVPFSTAGSKRVGAACGQHPYKPSMSLVTSDICKNDIISIQSNRKTNPLEPAYTVTGPKGAKITIGEVSGSKPKPQPKLRSDQPMLSLRSDDIDGATPLKRF